jgi:hypothetical protein
MIRQFHEFFNLISGGFLTFGTTSLAIAQQQKQHSGTNCTFTKFLYASLTRDSSALSPFLCMKTPHYGIAPKFQDTTFLLN